MNINKELQNLMKKMQILESKKKQTTDNKRIEEIENSLSNCRLAVSHYQFMKRPKIKKGMTHIDNITINSSTKKR